MITMTAFDKAWTVLKGYSDINWKNMGMDFGNDITWGVDEMCRNCGRETEEVHNNRGLCDECQEGRPRSFFDDFTRE